MSDNTRLGYVIDQLCFELMIDYDFESIEWNGAEVTAFDEHGKAWVSTGFKLCSAIRNLIEEIEEVCAHRSALAPFITYKDQPDV